MMDSSCRALKTKYAPTGTSISAQAASFLASYDAMTRNESSYTPQEWIDVCFPGCKKQGETYTSSGIFKGLKITGFPREAG
jgi:hypothetical protein